MTIFRFVPMLALFARRIPFVVCSSGICLGSDGGGAIAIGAILDIK